MKIEKLYTVTHHSSTIYTVKIDFNNLLIATGGKDRKVCLVELATGNFIRELGPFDDYVCDIAFAPDAVVKDFDYLYCGTCAGNNAFSIWNLLDGYLVCKLPARNVYAVTITSDGKKIAMAGTGLDIFILNVEHKVRITGIKQLPGDYGATERLCFSPDDQILASCSFGFDRTGRKPEKYGLRLWSTQTNSLIKEFPGTYMDADFFPDGKFLAATTQGGDITLIDVFKQEVTDVFNYLNNPKFKHQIIKFNPKGNIFAIYSIISEDSNKKKFEVKVFDWTSKELIQTIEARANVLSMAFSPNGKYLAIGENTALSLWSID